MVTRSVESTCKSRKTLLTNGSQQNPRVCSDIHLFPNRPLEISKHHSAAALLLVFRIRPTTFAAQARRGGAKTDNRLLYYRWHHRRNYGCLLWDSSKLLALSVFIAAETTGF